MMNDKKIIEVLEKAEELTESASLNDKYNNPAFEAVTRYLLGSLSASAVSPESVSADIPDHKIVAPTFASLLKKSNAHSHADKVLCAVYFLMKSKNMLVCTKEDIEAEYKNAYQPKSKNTAAEIRWLIKRALLMPSDEKIDGKTAYSITADGIDYMGEQLLKNVKEN